MLPSDITWGVLAPPARRKKFVQEKKAFGHEDGLRA